jgi:hypothetical protein
LNVAYWKNLNHLHGFFTFLLVMLFQFALLGYALIPIYVYKYVISIKLLQVSVQWRSSSGQRSPWVSTTWNQVRINLGYQCYKILAFFLYENLPPCALANFHRKNYFSLKPMLLFNFSNTSILSIKRQFLAIFLLASF